MWPGPGDWAYRALAGDTLLGGLQKTGREGFGARRFLPQHTRTAPSNTQEPCGLSHREQADRSTCSHRLCSCMYTHVFIFPGKPHLCSLVWRPADTKLWPFAATGSKRGGRWGGLKKKIPMTLKSFYSCNHRLPLTWIRAVTPAPACLPPRLPKLPAGRQTGKLPNYCQGGQGKERTWRGRLRKTDWRTEIQEEKGTQPPATKSRHRLKPSQLRYAQVHVHTFTIQIHHFGSTSRSQIYKHTDIHGS